jgi:glycosyltransferase involved in cell wall biosynthesis
MPLHMRKTLVILTPGFPKDEADSTCLPDRQIFVRVLQETYPETDIVVLTFQYPQQPGTYSWHGIKVISLGGKNKSGLYRRILWFNAWQTLKKLKKHAGIIGLLSFWLDECAFIANRFAKQYSLKHYAWLLGQDARPGNKYVGRMMPNGNNLIALSDFLAHEFARNYGVSPKHTIPGAIDPTTFNAYDGNRDIDLLGAGSLISLKQYSIFVDVVAEIKKDRPQIKALVCGKGPEMEMLQSKIDQLALQDNIILTGELPHAEVLALMQRAKIFMHPSNYEGFSTVCLEAVYAGAKVVSSIQPMKQGIDNWYIAKDAGEMQQIAMQLLSDKDIVYTSALPYRVTDTAKLVMQLFA